MCPRAFASLLLGLATTVLTCGLGLQGYYDGRRVRDGASGRDESLNLVWFYNWYRWRDECSLHCDAIPDGRERNPEKAPWEPEAGPCPLQIEWLFAIKWFQRPYTTAGLTCVGWPIRFAAFGWFGYYHHELERLTFEEDRPGLATGELLGSDIEHADLMGWSFAYYVPGVVLIDRCCLNICIHSAAWFAMLTAGGVSFRALSRRFRKTGGCPQCGYPPVESSPRCPECGFTRQQEKSR